MVFHLFFFPHTAGCAVRLVLQTMLSHQHRAETQHPGWWPKPVRQGGFTALGFVYSASADTPLAAGKFSLFLACL